MPTLIIYACIAIAAVGTLIAGYAKVHGDGVKQGEAQVQTKWDAANREAEVQARAKEAADKQAKEKADAAHQAAVDRLNASVAKLRADADKRRAAFLPSTAPASGGADTACFDRNTYLGAYGSLVEGLRGLANEGTQAVSDLDDLKRRAQKGALPH